MANDINTSNNDQVIKKREFIKEDNFSEYKGKNNVIWEWKGPILTPSLLKKKSPARITIHTYYKQI